MLQGAPAYADAVAEALLEVGALELVGVQARVRVRAHLGFAPIVTPQSPQRSYTALPNILGGSASGPMVGGIPTRTASAIVTYCLSEIGLSRTAASPASSA